MEKTMSKNLAKGKNNTIAPKAAKFVGTLSAITVAEIAVIGAAGFVLWKNREKIQDFLEDKGVDLSSFKGDIGDWIQRGVDFVKERTESVKDKQLHS